MPETDDGVALSRWQRLAAIDTRALAAMRIGLATVFGCDLLARATDFEAHYTEFGVLPVAAARQWLSADGQLSLYLVSGSTAWQAALFALSFATAVTLALGWRTRIATVAAFVLALSLHQRNPAVTLGGDNMLRFLLFWAVFLPLGAAASLDARRGGAAPPRRVLSVASFGLLWQVTLIYEATAIQKLVPEWTTSFDAVGLALGLDRMTTPLGHFVRGLPALTRLATPSVLALELAGPILVWSIWKTRRIREIVVALFVAFHLLLLAPTLHLGLFPWVCAVAWIPFLPFETWNALRERRSGTFASEKRVQEAGIGRAGPGTRRSNAIPNAIAAVAVVLATYLAARDAGAPLPALAGPAGLVLRVAGFDQGWKMFTRVHRTDGWIAVPGALASGRSVDLWTGAPSSDIRPASVARQERNVRWAKYLELLIEPKGVFHRRLFADYLCRLWNREHAPDPVASASIVFFREEVLSATTKGPVQPMLLWSGDCPGAAATAVGAAAEAASP